MKTSSGRISLRAVGAVFLSAALSFSVTQTAFGAAAKKASSTRSAPLSANDLSFDVSARLAAIQGGKPSDMPAQTFDARVSIKGRNARVETEIGDRAVVYLLTPPHLTKLLPGSKAGVRWKIAQNVALPGATGAGLASELQNLMRDPASLRGTLKRRGARLIGKGNLNGAPVEIYQTANFMGQGQKMTAWLRRSDALPLRVQLASRTLQSTLSWRNYKRAALSDALFRVPAGYNVRNSTGQPSF